LCDSVVLHTTDQQTDLSLARSRGRAAGLQVPHQVSAPKVNRRARLRCSMIAAALMAALGGSAAARAAVIPMAASAAASSAQVPALTLTGVTGGQSVAGNVTVTATLSGAAGDRVVWSVDGNLRSDVNAAPPYQYTWYTAAEANGPHTITAQVYPAGSDTPVGASATVTVSNKLVYPPTLAYGEESMYSEFNQGDSASGNATAVASNLLNNVWPARGYPLVNLGWPLTWTEDPYNDAYWRFYFYSLRPLSALLYEWETTHQQPYLDKLLAILSSYEAYDQSRPIDTLTFDNDHASAYRAMVLTNLYFKLSDAGVLTADLQTEMYGSLEKLGAFLANPAHFEGDVNHGFNEGAALLLVADNFPQMPAAGQWRQTAISRLQDMLASTLDPDGVEIEQSPFYHVYVLGLVYQIAQWAKQYEPELAPSYSAAAQAMLRFAAYITQPSGYLPMLGATATTYMPSQDPSIYAPMAATDPEFQFAYTRGAQGTPPPDGVVLFPSSGVFILRSPLGNRTNLGHQTYMTFQAGPYRTDHSNLDALGVTMYAAGQTVLPTSGLFTYTQQPDRTYFHGTSAHNTVVVDGQDQSEGTAHEGPHGNEGASSYASGTSDLYAGVHHRRTVVALRQDLSLVVDQLHSAADHTYTQTWHPDPSVQLRQNGQDALISSPAGAPLLAIHQADPTGETFTALKGQTSPVMAGWYSNEYGIKTPSYQVQYTRQAQNAQFSTLLAAGVYADDPATVSDHSVTGGVEVDACLDANVGYTVTVPDDENAAVTITTNDCIQPPSPPSSPQMLTAPGLASSSHPASAAPPQPSPFAVTWTVAGRPVRGPRRPHVHVHDTTVRLSAPVLPAGAVAYLVYRMRLDGTPGLLGRRRRGRAFTDSHLRPGRYTYRLVAVNAQGQRSAPSRPFSVFVRPRHRERWPTPPGGAATTTAVGVQAASAIGRADAVDQALLLMSPTSARYDLARR